MNLSRRWIARACLVTAAIGIARFAGPVPDTPNGLSEPDNRQQISQRLAAMPLHFEPHNEPQTFRARGLDYGLLLKPTAMQIALHGRSAAQLETRLIGANGAAGPIAEQRLPSHSNYFLGSDRSQWRTNVPHYARVGYANVYPGIDIAYYGKAGEIEYDFIVAPGADPADIRLQYIDAHDVRIDDAGNLRVTVGGGEIVHHKPIAYQTLVSGVRAAVQGAFRLVGNASVAFDLGKYDASLPLVIDPVLTYASYLGGSDEDSISAIAVDAAGAVYVAGETQSANFPVTAGAAQSTHGSPNSSDDDAFVAKFNPQGTALEYSTFLGGDEFDEAMDIEVDAAGTVFVAGRTGSGNFPTAAAFDATYGGNYPRVDIFVAHLNAQGTALLYSTYLGGAQEEVGNGSLGLRI
ncbi:MAG TPA: SBBP repeat-containing protein, partial [Povalibacter sp.]